MAITAPRALLRYPWLRKRARDVWTTFYQLTHGHYFVGKRLGLRLLFDTDNVVDKYLLAYGVYEEDRVQQLFAAAREAVAGQKGPCVFLDVGAHWGIYALLAQQSGLFDRVIAVEADGRNAAQLRANLFLNQLCDEVEVVEAAASKQTGELVFQLAGQRSRVVSKVAGPGVAHGATTRTVRAVAIDDIVAVAGGVVVAKIDVEGHEPAAIEGMARLLEQNRAVLQIEVYDATVAEFAAAMAARGYRCFAQLGDDRYFRNF